MAKILYTFSGGHEEEIEVTEEFKVAYEFELAREKARYWKQYRQKERAGLPTGHDWSLNKIMNDGIDYAAKDDVLSKIIEKERQDERRTKAPSCLTTKQREVYILHKKGWTQRRIAKHFGLALSTVNDRLQNARKNIYKFFSENPNI